MRSTHILTLFTLALAPAALGCAERELSLGSGSNSLTTTPCDRCDFKAYPGNIVCPQGAKVACWLRTDGTCAWDNKCPGAPGPSGGGGAGGNGTVPGTGGSGTPPGAGVDAGSAACDPNECGSKPTAIPQIGCASGTTPQYVCQRLNGKCQWQLSCPGNVTCGSKTCPMGQVCCNASCGICTPPGGACTQQFCGNSVDAAMGYACPGTNPAMQCRTSTANQCIPSSCSCTKDGWACTADCGGGVNCGARDASAPPPDGPVCTAAECGPEPLVGACLQCGTDSGCAPMVCKRWSDGKCSWRLQCLTWYSTCGDPVCGQFRRDPNVPLCTTQKRGASCAKEGDKCQVPNDACNTYLICGATDPKTGGCPISRASYKRDIRYLAPDEIQQRGEELLSMKLATWRYKDAPERERLGFIIDDQINSHAGSYTVEASGDRVDLYGYTSLAVAALQHQAREIDALKKELAALKRQLRKGGR